MHRLSLPFRRGEHHLPSREIVGKARIHPSLAFIEGKEIIPTYLGVSAAPPGGTGGAHALSFNFRQGPDGGEVVLLVPLCDSQGAQFNPTTNTFSFSLFFKDDPGSPPFDPFAFSAFHAFRTGNGLNHVISDPANTFQPGIWLNFTTQIFPGAGDIENATGITLLILQNWSGTIFVDNVHF
jgi:hypothetical protein